MEKAAVIGELLYTGFVYEKGRCKARGIWKFGYRKELAVHLEWLKKLANCLETNQISKEDNALLNEFITKFALGFTNSQGSCIYHFSSNVLAAIQSKDCILITEHNDTRYFPRVNNLILAMLDDLLLHLARTLIDKPKVHMLLRALHNLPRCYLSQNAETLCMSNNRYISIDQVLDYSFSNMDKETREKYRDHIIISQDK